MDTPVDMFAHRDPLKALDGNLPLARKVEFIHRHLRAHYDFVDRIAIALHERDTDLLKTFIHSSGEDRPLSHYHTRLSDAPSLREILERGTPRVVNDLSIFAASGHEHARKISEQGYGASYTWPMYYQGTFFGFIFINSYRRGCFSDRVLSHIDPILRLLAVVVVSELNSLQTLTAALKTTSDLTRHRDNETGTHLDRMARYAQLIARDLAPRYGFDDEYVEHLFLFAPLHDVGKIAIPDSILLKPGRLDGEEFKVMQTHTLRGREIIDQMMRNFDLDRSPHAELLRNIAVHHHEALNGSGYPAGLSGENIPMEARIIAVADVFDALTSKRPYKEAWEIDRAFATLLEMADEKLDRDCVAALIRHREEVESIQQTFAEDPIG
ncbi:HD-GYP domain-containing protein [Endothiovibrio diazotrophicus]